MLVQPTAPTSTTGPQFSSTNTRQHNAVIFPDDVDPSTTTTIRDRKRDFQTEY